jgi:hypothetical protein
MRKVLLHCIPDILTPEFELVEATTADHLEEGQFLTDFLDSTVPFEAVFF